MPGPKIVSRWLIVCALLGALPSSAWAKGLTGWTDQQLAKRAADYVALNPASIARQITVQADDLEPVATFTSEPIYKFRGGFTNEVRADTFLRVLVNRKTGATNWQVYQRLTYLYDRRDFESANYAGDDGPASVSLVISDSRLSYDYGVCVHEDTLAFDLHETIVRQIAARPAAAPWRFRFKSRIGRDWTDDLPPAEFASMLIAVERWRADHNLP